MKIQNILSFNYDYTKLNYVPSQQSRNQTVEPIRNDIHFGYSSILKKEWRAGNLPSVKRGLYGDVLTKNNLSLEHIQTRESGGISALKNYALASKRANWLRGNKDIHEFLTIEMIRKYLSQFIGVKTRKFDGDKYIQMVTPTFEKLGYSFNSK